jgi:hypothetical protein
MYSCSPHTHYFPRLDHLTGVRKGSDEQVFGVQRRDDEKDFFFPVITRRGKGMNESFSDHTIL